jgi:hypothetical protein
VNHLVHKFVIWPLHTVSSLAWATLFLKPTSTSLYPNIRSDLYGIYQYPFSSQKQSRLPVDAAGSTSVPDASSTISISVPEATSTVQYLVGLLLSGSQVKLDVPIWDFSPSYLLQYQYQVESHCLHIKLDPSASGISSYYSVFNIKLVAQSTIYY